MTVCIEKPEAIALPDERHNAYYDAITKSRHWLETGTKGSFKDKVRHCWQVQRKSGVYGSVQKSKYFPHVVAIATEAGLETVSLRREMSAEDIERLQNVKLPPEAVAALQTFKSHAPIALPKAVPNSIDATVDRKELARVVASLEAMVRLVSHAGLGDPLLEIFANQSSLRLSVADCDFRCQIELPARVDRSILACVSARLFAQLLKKLPGDEVRLSLRERRLTIKSDSFDCWIGISESLPSLAISADEAIEGSVRELSLDAKSWRSLLEPVIPFAAKEEHISLSNICLEAHLNKGLIPSLAAIGFCNQFGLEVKTAIREREIPQIVFGRQIAKQAALLMKTGLQDECYLLRYSEESGIASFVSEKKLLVFRKANQQYPPVRELLTQRNKGQLLFTCDRQALLDGLKLMEACQPEQHVLGCWVDVCQRDQSVTLSVNEPSNVQEGLFSVLEGSQAICANVEHDHRCMLNASFLHSVLQAINRDRIEVWGKGKNEPFYVTDHHRDYQGMIAKIAIRNEGEE